MVNSFVLVAAAAGASLVAAQNLTGNPDCAVACLTPAIASICTPADDTACACANTSNIGLAAVDCLLSSCDSAELTQAQSAGAQVCVDYSATASPVASSTAGSTAASTAAATTAVTTGSANATDATVTTTASSSSANRATATSTSSSASATSTDASSAAAAAAVGAFGPVLGFAAALVAGAIALL